MVHCIQSGISEANAAHVADVCCSQCYTIRNELPFKDKHISVKQNIPATQSKSSRCIGKEANWVKHFNDKSTISSPISQSIDPQDLHSWYKGWRMLLSNFDHFFWGEYSPLVQYYLSWTSIYLSKILFSFSFVTRCFLVLFWNPVAQDLLGNKLPLAL